jgi:two-component system, NarL family, response regulator LiaR
MTTWMNFLRRNKHIILYGTLMALLLWLLKWLELRFIIIDHAFELYIGAIALIFTGLGIWLALKLAKPKIKTMVVEKQVYLNNNPFEINSAALEKLNISKRELEVLELMSHGLSNHEIAERLFVSLSTIKTHSRNIFDKMGVARRTQAIDMAKKLNIIR